MLGIESRCAHGTFEIETQPLLNSTHSATLGKVQEQYEVENDGRREDAVSAKKVYFNLHRIAEPTVDIHVVPAFLVVAPRGVVMNPDLVRKVLVKIGIQLRLEDLVEHRQLAFLLRFERIR